MKVIRERTFRVQYVVPETADERADIKRILQEVESEKVGPEDLKNFKRHNPGADVGD